MPSGETPLIRLSSGATSADKIVSAQHPILQKFGMTPEALQGLNQPPPGDGPQQVKAGLKVLTIPGIDEPQESFHIHAALDLEWQDRRLRSPRRTSRVVFREEEATLLMRYIWWPDVDFFNGSDKLEVDNRILVLEPDGRVRLHQLVDAPLSFHSNLRMLPFDRQKLPMIMESFGVGSDSVLLEPNMERSGFDDQFLPPDWNIIDFEVTSRLHQASWDRDATVSQALFQVTVKRHGQYYLWRIMLPMVMVVMVTWWIYWVPVTDFVSRLETGLMGILTLVAFNLVVLDTIPNISYLTLLDVFYLVGLLSVFMAILESLWVSQMATGAHGEVRAVRINRRFRYLAPLMTMGVWALVLTLPLWV